MKVHLTLFAVLAAMLLVAAGCGSPDDADQPEPVAMIEETDNTLVGVWTQGEEVRLELREGGQLQQMTRRMLVLGQGGDEPQETVTDQSGQWGADGEYLTLSFEGTGFVERYRYHVNQSELEIVRQVEDRAVGDPIVYIRE